MLNEPIEQGAISEPEARTFTQEEVNRIVSDRLSKEKIKAEAAALLREKEIGRREYAYYTQKTLEEKKLPSYLINAFSGGDKEAFDKGIEVIERAVKEATDIHIAERMKGAPPKASSSTSTADATIRGAMGLK